MLSLFSCAFWPPVCLLWRNMFQSSARSLIDLFVFYIELYELFIYLDFFAFSNYSLLLFHVIF